MDLTVFSHSFIMLFYLLIICYIYKRLLTPRENLQHVFLFSFLVMTPDLLVSILNYHLVVYVHWLFIALPLFFFYQDSIKRRLTCYIVVYLILLFGELFGFFIACVIASIQTGNVITPQQVEGGQALLAAFCTILSDTVMALLAASFLKSLFAFLSAGTIALIGFPVILCTVLHTLVSIWPSLIFLLAFLFPLCYFILHRGFQNMQRQERSRQQKESQRLLLEKQLLYSQELEAEYQRLRKWNHDISNHLMALSYLLENKKYQEGDAYIQSLLENSDFHMKTNTGGTHSC